MSVEQTLIDFTQDCKYVDRWGGVRVNGYRRNLAEHQYEVAGYGLALLKHLSSAEINIDESEKLYILKLCLTHDLPEVVTGDVKYVVKRDNPDLVRSLDKIESETMDRFEMGDNSYTQTVKYLVKLCDILAVEREISEELEINPNNPKFTLDNVRKIITDVHNKYNFLPNELLQIGKDFLNKFKYTNEEIC